MQMIGQVECKWVGKSVQLPTITFTINFKLAQVRIASAKSSLDHAMQLAQDDVFRHRNPTPDRRFYPFKFYVQYQHTVGFNQWTEEMFLAWIKQPRSAREN